MMSANDMIGAMMGVGGGGPMGLLQAMLGSGMVGGGRGGGGLQIGDAMLGLEGLSYEQLLAMFGDGSTMKGMSEEDVAKLKAVTFEGVGGDKKAAATTDEQQQEGAAAAGTNNRDESNELTCSICLDEFVVGDQLVALPCKHRFHKECIARWLTTNGVCPVCKAEVNKKDD